MDIFNSYGFIIVACLVIIISYFFNQIAKKTSIPSVLLLILLGILINQLNRATGLLPEINLMPVLEVLGIIGLIMIVLEAALELKISRDKMEVIWKSLLISLILLGLNAFMIAWLIKLIWVLDWYISFIYAVPLSIMSSAIVIPSVKVFEESKKEFLTYESTFSDILGIMVFYFLLQAGEVSGGELALSIPVSILITVAVSVIAGYGLLFLFQKIKGGSKLFLIIAVLVLLYSTGKLFHLSSLLLILVFGLILSNINIFGGGKLRKYFDHEAISKIYEDFNLITIESTFIVRTFFFLVFGLTISLVSISDSRVMLVSLGILSVVFIARYLLLFAFFGKASYPQWQIAPRGLITILLFYDIPGEYRIEDFVDFEGVILLVILVSSSIMALSMISYRSSQNNSDKLNSKEAETENPEQETNSEEVTQ